MSILTTAALFAALLQTSAPETVSSYLQLPTANRLLNEGKFAEAKPIYEKYVKTNPYLGSQWRNLAVCEFRLGNYEAAIAAYRKAAPTYFNTNECLFGIARSYAKMKNKQGVLDALKALVDNKWPELADAIHDADFAFLTDDPEYRKVVGLPPAGNFSRDEKWRYDLEFLRKESYRRHFSPFLFTRRETLDSFMDSVIKRVPDLSDEQIVLEMNKFMAMFGDGHTVVISPELGGGHGFEESPSFLDKDVWPVRIKWFTDGWYIVEATAEHKSLLGRKLIGIDGINMDQIAEKVRPIMSRDNEEWIKVILPFRIHPAMLYGLGITKDRKSVRLDTSGGPVAVNAIERVGSQFVPLESAGSPALYKKNPGEHYWMERLDDGLLYLRYAVCIDVPAKPIAQFWQQALAAVDDPQTTRVIIDMRGNRGGQGQLFDPMAKGLAQRTKLAKTGAIFALIDRETYSAALYACGKLEYIGALFVGAPTGGAPNFVGEIDPMRLPFSGVMASASSQYNQNAYPSDHRPFFPPRIVAELTFEQWRTNQDPGLEVIREYCRQNPLR